MRYSASDRVDVVVPAIDVAIALAGVDVEAAAPVVEPVRAARDAIEFVKPHARAPDRGLEPRLGRAQRHLGALLRVDVDRHADHRDRLAIEIPFDDTPAVHQPFPGAIGAAQPVFEFEVLRTPFEVLIDQALHRGLVVGVDAGQPGLRLLLPGFAAVAGHREPQRAAHGGVARTMDLPEGRARPPQRGRQARLVLLRLDLGALARVDFDADAAGLQWHAIGAAPRDAATLQQPQPARVPRQDPVLDLELAATTCGHEIGMGAQEPASVVGMDAPGPAIEVVRARTGVEVQRQAPGQVDLGTPRRQAAVPGAHLRRDERAPPLGGSARVRRFGVRQWVHSSLTVCRICGQRPVTPPTELNQALPEVAPPRSSG